MGCFHMELEPEDRYPIEEREQFEFSPCCRLKRIDGHDVVDFIFSEHELYSWYVIEHFMVLDGNKIGRTMIHIRTNGPGQTVYYEVLK